MQAPAVAGAQQSTPIRVASTLDDNVTPILYGLKAGIFSRHGLDVTLTPFRSGAAQSAAIAGGAIDIGKTSLFSLITAHLRGVAFKIVAPSGLYLHDAPTTGLIVAKDAPYKTASDLNGKTFSAASLHDLDEVAIRGWIDQNGGDSTTLKFIELPNAAVPQALAQRRIDAAALVNPTLFEALDSGTVRVIGRPFDSIGHRFMIAVWFCNPAFAQRDPDAVRRFAQAFHEAALFTNAHHDQTVGLLADFSHIKPDVIARMVRSTTGLTLAPADLQPEIDAAARYKMIDHAFPASELLAV